MGQSGELERQLPDQWAALSSMQEAENLVCKVSQDSLGGSLVAQETSWTMCIHC